MPQLRTIRIGALNIKLHPHSPKRYTDLFKDIYELNRPIEFRANHYALLGSLLAIDSDKPFEGLYGHLFRFLDFDRSHPWLNLYEHKAADDQDLREVRIPDHLKPNLLMFEYVFFPKQHRLLFETKTDGGSLSPRTAKKIFDLQFKQTEILRNYGEIDVIIEPERETLRKILAIPGLNKLHIRITRPNPDDQDEYETEILRRLNAQNASQYETSFTAIRGERLEPDNQTKALAQVAVSNGVVEGRGKNEEGRVITESTLDHPLEAVATYNPDVQTSHGAFLRLARSMLRRILQ